MRACVYVCTNTRRGDFEFHVSSDPKEVTVADGISDQDLVAEATGRKKYIYGFRGRKYYIGKPWDVFAR